MPRREWNSSTVVTTSDSLSDMYLDATSPDQRHSDPYIDVAAEPVAGPIPLSRHVPPPQHVEELYERYRQPASNRALRSYNERTYERQGSSSVAATGDGFAVDVTPVPSAVIDVTPLPVVPRGSEVDEEENYVVGQKRVLLNLAPHVNQGAVEGHLSSVAAAPPHRGEPIAFNRGPLLQPPTMRSAYATSSSAVGKNSQRSVAKRNAREKDPPGERLEDSTGTQQVPTLPVSPERCDRYLVEWLFVYQQEQHERHLWEGRELHRRQLLALEHKHKTRLARMEQAHDEQVTAVLDQYHDPSFAAVEQAALEEKLQSLTLELQEAQQALGALNTEHSNRSIDADRVFDREFEVIRSERKNLLESMRAMELSLSSSFHLAKDDMIDRNYEMTPNTSARSYGGQRYSPSTGVTFQHSETNAEQRDIVVSVPPPRPSFGGRLPSIPRYDNTTTKQEAASIIEASSPSSSVPPASPEAQQLVMATSPRETPPYAGAVDAVSLQDLTRDELRTSASSPGHIANGASLTRSSSELGLPLRQGRIVQPPPADFFEAAGRRVAPALNLRQQPAAPQGRITVSRILHDASDVITKSGLSVAQALGRISHHTN